MYSEPFCVCVLNKDVMVMMMMMMMMMRVLYFKSIKCILFSCFVLSRYLIEP